MWFRCLPFACFIERLGKSNWTGKADCLKIVMDECKNVTKRILYVCQMLYSELESTWISNGLKFILLWQFATLREVREVISEELDLWTHQECLSIIVFLCGTYGLKYLSTSLILWWCINRERQVLAKQKPPMCILPVLLSSSYNLEIFQCLYACLKV